MGKFTCVYIFESTEDRRNKAMYQELAELIYRQDSYITPHNIAMAEKSDCFYESFDDAYEGNTKDTPKFKTGKGDMFLWVEGRRELMNTEQLYRVAQTQEEKELVDRVMIGYACHYDAGAWFVDLADEIPKRIIGKATELMRRKEYKEKAENSTVPKGKRVFYILQDGEEGIFAMWKEKAEERAKSLAFVNKYIVTYEGVATNTDMIWRRTETNLLDKYRSIPGEKTEINMSGFYDIMFRYFKRLQWMPNNAPDNFWDWLTPEVIDKHFQSASLYAATKIFMCEDANGK